MVDIYPTLTALAGLDTPAAVSGISLAPMLADVSRSVRQAAFTQFGTGYSIRTERYRYTHWGPDGSLGAELYDHQNDSVEMVNLANRPESAAVVKELSALLKSRIAQANVPPKGVRQIRFENRRAVPQPNP
jgi:arylsulfatase A-like enzyme